MDEGVTSFKLFMAYPGVFYSDDAQILKAMQKSAEHGPPTMMHAENGPAIDVLAEQLYSAGMISPYYHGIARAWQMEETTYVVHVIGKQAVEQLAASRDGLRQSAKPVRNSTPLEDQLGAPGFEGAKVGVFHAAAGSREVIKTRCQALRGPTTYRSFPLITARSA